MSVEIGRSGGAATIRLADVATRNALDPDMVAAVRQALADARRDPNVAAVILSSSVMNIFSTGMNLNLMTGDDLSVINRGEEHLSAYVELLVELADMPVPSLALVDGLAVGGGVDLAGSCDMLIATPRARFSIGQLAKGVFPLTTSAVLIPQIGAGTFLRWSLSGVIHDGRKLASMGLAIQCCATEDLGSVADKIVRRIVGFHRDILQDGIKVVRATERDGRVARLRSAGAQLVVNCGKIRERR